MQLACITLYAGGVPILQIRDFPDSLYGKLAQSAKIERRSLARQATVLLEQALNAPTEPRARRLELLNRFSAPAIRRRLPARPSPERLIRKDRER
jgi:hypothetical protein